MYSESEAGIRELCLFAWDNVLVIEVSDNKSCPEIGDKNASKAIVITTDNNREIPLKYPTRDRVVLAVEPFKVLVGMSFNENSAVRFIIIAGIEKNLGRMVEDFEKAKSADIEQMLNTSKSYTSMVPKIPTGIDKEFWEHAWIVHRTSTFEPEGIMVDKWECSGGRFYPRCCMAMWDTLHNIEDTMWIDIDRATGQMRNHLMLYREKDAMFANLWDSIGCRVNLDEAECPEERDFSCSQPPLWGGTIWELYLRTRDKQFLTRAYEICRKNIEWWEKKREIANTGLFEACSSGYDNSLRYKRQIQETALNVKNMGAIDLSSQMAMYYDYVGRMAEELGHNEDSMLFKKRFVALTERVRNTCWDDNTNFFYDFDFSTDSLVKIKTIAGFWPLVAGICSDEQADWLVKHLLNPKEFWSEMPVPSTSLDSEGFCYDMWRGPVWLSQNYWVLKGLLRYGYRDVAAELARRSLCAAEAVFKADKRIYEFYNPREMTIRNLTRKGFKMGPFPYYPGHNPIYAIAFTGLLGLSTTAEGLRIMPSRSHINEEISCSFYFGKTFVRLVIDSKHLGDQMLVRLDNKLREKCEKAEVVIPYTELLDRREVSVAITM
ncbi:MAG: trehalase family glycosidase [Planctomycetota bacterium]